MDPWPCLPPLFYTTSMLIAVIEVMIINTAVISWQLDAPVVRVSPQNITVNESMDVLIFCTYDATPPTLTSVQWLL